MVPLLLDKTFRTAESEVDKNRDELTLHSDMRKKGRMVKNVTEWRKQKVR